jgi:uncharacterized protein YecE (DUF72 family)
MIVTPGRCVDVSIRVGCAGWRMPKAAGGAEEETHLQRYARVFSGVEINSSFHRPHRRATYARWGAGVGEDFSFSVKIPKVITHQRRLADVTEPLGQFLEEVSGLGRKLGCLLVQLPPGRGRMDAVDEAFFENLRSRTDVDIVCEPRHPDWFNAETDAMLANFRVARVIADPQLDPRTIPFSDGPPVTYIRLHGTPKIYYSEYGHDALEHWRAVLTTQREAGNRCWCIFDNTAAGQAIVNAEQLVRKLGE